MRTLTANTVTSVSTQYGTEPVTLIQIDWDAGTAYYADKDTTPTGGDTYAGKIISLSPIDTSARLDNLSAVAALTLVLDDTDDVIRPTLNTDTIVGTPIRVYQHFEGNADTDKTLLFDGVIGGDPIWDEGQRTVSLSAETVGNGGLSTNIFQKISLLEQSADPLEPSDGETIIWMSDGTGKGDAGDVMIASNQGGTTRYATLFDYSAGTAW